MHDSSVRADAGQFFLQEANDALCNEGVEPLHQWEGLTTNGRNAEIFSKSGIQSAIL